MDDFTRIIKILYNISIDRFILNYEYAKEINLFLEK